MTDTLVPRPRSVTRSEGTVDLTEVSAVVHPTGNAATAGARRVGRLLADELGLSVEPTSTAPRGGIPVRVERASVEGTASDEAYRLSVTPSEVSIRAPTAAGVYYGGQTLVQLARFEGGSLTVPTCEVSDWPEHEWRGFMADPARGFIPVERLKTLVDRMAGAKLNTLHLHLVDSESWTLAFERYPELAGGPAGDSPSTYSREDVAELVEYADERGITIVPEIDVPGHGLTLLANLPGLRCETGERVRSFGRKSAICIGRERTYEFVENVLDEVVDLFPADVVHVGADEWVHHGVNWGRCEHCRRRMREEGHEDVRDLFYYFLRRVHGMLSERGKRMMVWNDQIDVSEAPDLPRDIIVQFWLVSYGEWGPPQEGNSMQRFIEEGFDVVNSRTTATYADVLDGDLLLEWNPTRLPAVDPAHEASVLGSEMPAWNGWRTEARRRYFQRTLPSLLPVYGDRVWNGAPVSDRAVFREAVTRHVLGPCTPSEYDLYRDLGGVVLPTGDAESTDWANVDVLLRERSVQEATEGCERSLALLRELEASDLPPPPDVVEAYRDTLAWLVDVLDRERRGLPTRPDSVPDVE